MALDFSKITLFKNLNARSRVLVLFGSAIGIIFTIYILVRLLSGGDNAAGNSRVANAPSGLQSVQGGTLTPEYYKSLQLENKQRAQQAAITGASAIPTVINAGQSADSTNQCNIICSDESTNVKTNLDDWLKQGTIGEETAGSLQDLANKNGPVSEYEQYLNQLVKDGKLTPEQARELLSQYKKQHANKLLIDSAKSMDDMIKSGILPIDVANQLLAAQKSNMSSADYAALLNQMVKDGKISPETAQKLLGQYNQQIEKEMTKEGIAKLNEMAKEGQLTPDVAKQLIDLQNNNTPYDAYAAAIQKLLNAGKITPLVANKLLEAYKNQKLSTASENPVRLLLRQAEADAYKEIRDLLANGQITKETADQLTGMIQQNISLDEFKAAVAKLVDKNKLTPAIAKLKIADYTKIKMLRDLLDHLTLLQANKASSSLYADTLKQAVQAGVLTPEEASETLNSYKTGEATGNDAYAKLQEQMQGGKQEPEDQFAAVQNTAEETLDQDRATRIQAFMTAMSTQAEQLVTLWQAPLMTEKAGSAEKDMKDSNGEMSEDGTLDRRGSKNHPDNQKEGGGDILIKAGTIIFGVLDTTVNSDYPDSPVLVTIVDGKYKGAKLMGKLITAKSVAGQLDRITLNFTLMNMDEWTKSKTVTAYAIDPDSARTVLASHVDYHYLQRYGAIMATSFVQGYANAIASSSSTTTTGIFGTSTTHPQLSPSQKLATAIGQIGTSLGNQTQNYTNIPPTVTVDSGVGLGILFMSDLTT